MNTAVSVIAAPRFAQACRQLRWQVHTGDGLKGAASAARDHLADAPILVITSDDYPVQQPLVVALTQNATALVAIDASELPVQSADVARRLGLHLDGDLAETSIQRDGGVTGQTVPEALDLDSVIEQMPASSDDAEPTSPTIGGGWDDDDDADETVVDDPGPLPEVIEYWSLDEGGVDEVAPAAPVDAPVTAPGTAPAQPAPIVAEADNVYAQAGQLVQQQRLHAAFLPPVPATPPLPQPYVSPAAATSAHPDLDALAPQSARTDEAAPQSDLAAQLAALQAENERLRAADAAGRQVSASDPYEAADRAAQGATRHGRPAEVLIVMAGGGGVGKTSTSATIAQLAGKAGLRTLCIDGTRGQPDITSVVLRMADASRWPRTITSANRGAGLGDAVIEAAEANQVRRERAGDPGEDIAFDSVFSPHAGEHSAATITEYGANLFTKVTSQLRNSYDLIVIDSQTLDNDSSDVWDEFLFPQIRAGAWTLAISDQTRVKQQHLVTQLARMEQAGLPMAKVLVMFTMMPSWTEEDQQLVSRLFPQARLVGATLESGEFRQSFSQWRIDTSIQAVTDPMRGVLHTLYPQVAAFNPDLGTPSPRRKFSLSRLFGGR